MANYYARLSGNIDASIWATSPSGTAAAVTFASGDVLVANSFTITINVSTNLGGAGQIRNDNLGGATSGGSFTLSNGVTLTANINAHAGFSCCTSSGSVSASVIGNITVLTGNNGIGIANSSSGTLTITGNVSGKQNATLSGCFGVLNSGTGTVVLTGNVLGGLGGTDYGINNTGSGTVIITGTVSGQTAIGAFNNTATGTVTITGSVNAGNGAAGASNLSTGTFTISGDITASNGANGFTSANSSATNRLSGSFINSANGTAAIYAAKYILNSTPLLAKTRYALNGIGSYVDMFTADNTSGISGVATTNVRSGISYGGGLVGTCAVPNAGTVAFGVAVDNTTGTATLTAANLRAALGMASANLDTQLAVLSNLDTTVSSRLAPSGTLARVTLTDTATTLTNAPASVTPAQIRAEMDSNSTKLANLDATVSSRLASSVSTNITAIKAKTDLLNTDRLAQCATTSIVGNLIAQSNS